MNDKTMFRYLFCCFSGLFLALTGPEARADDWPHWRGPQMNGVTSGEAPTEWSQEKNILWKQPLPGSAGSTPIVHGGRIFLTSADKPELLLMAFDAKSGQLVWQRTVSTGDATFFGDEGNLASPSPSTDGQHVVAVMGNGDMSCYTVDGLPVWKLDLSERINALDIKFGYSSSPIVHQGRVYVQWIHGDGDTATEEARIICLDLKSGDTIWEQPRITGAKKECEHSYASPIIVGTGEAAQLVTHGADHAVAYRLSDGTEIWRVGGVNSPGNYHPTLRFVASPASDGKQVIIPTAKKGPVVCVSADGEGDLTDGDYQHWRVEGATPDVPSPIVQAGLVYLCGENGNLTCLEATTGKRVYRKRTVADRHRASPLLVDDKLYLTSRKGVITVIQAGRDFEILAKNDLGEYMTSSPVLVDGVLYLRTFEALYAIAEN